MSKFKGDYMGFTYNGIHSSDLGIVRTSDGSRFNENLLPTSQDKTVQVPGRDGTYYFGSYYTQKPINVSFAFDALTEEQILYMQQVFGDKKPHGLVFDERPYKEYQAKVTGTATIKYIPFDEGDSGRLYKGEGTISFTCYQPMAVCKHKYLDDEYYQDFDNIEEWRAASGLLETQGKYDTFQFVDKYEDLDKESAPTEEIARLKTYNSGVEGADWVLKVNANNAKFRQMKLVVRDSNNKEYGSLFFKGCGVKSKQGFTDNALTFNSKTGLIEGWYENQNEGQNFKIKTGTIYNDCLRGGEFFKIPVNIRHNPVSNDEPVEIYFDIEGVSGGTGITLDYDYYYY